MSVVEIEEVHPHMKMDSLSVGINQEDSYMDFNEDNGSWEEVEVWGRLDTDVYILMQKNHEEFAQWVVPIMKVLFFRKLQSLFELQFNS